MLANVRIRMAATGVFSALLAVGAMTLQQKPPAAPCVDYSADPAGCQPSTFKTPLAQMPGGRVNRQGIMDPKASEADAKAGVALLEKKLRLFRNFEHLHWVPLIPSVKDPATGEWKGGDLDGAGDERSFAIGGNCIYAGHSAAKGVNHPMNVLKIQPNPEKQAPVLVGEIPTPPPSPNSMRGIDDKEVRALVYQVAPGQDRMILVRLVSDVETYRIDPNTCLPIGDKNTFAMAGGPHEFFLWHDPANPKRVLIYMAMWGGGIPDPEHPGLNVPDLIVFAVTDENTGEVLPKPKVLAGFSLQDVGGPRHSEKPDETGLFSDGRFANYSQLKDRFGRAGTNSTQQPNNIHSNTVSDNGERVYVAGSSTGFYVLNSEAIAHHSDAQLAAGTAGCNQRSTIVTTGTTIDASKLAHLANDCLHMVVNDDPGLKAFLGFAAPDAKIQRYLTLMTRSRFDPFPPINVPLNGTHSAVAVPGRPAQVNGNTNGRPAYVLLTDENGGCPSMYGHLVSVESETTPLKVGSFSVPDNTLDECLDQPNVEPNGAPRTGQVGQQTHNPTVFKNLAFVGWYGHGIRALDISRPLQPREVGHALTLPGLNGARGYPVFKDGLMYWVGVRNGLHVAKYTGPRSDEIQMGSGLVFDSNTTSPHR